MASITPTANVRFPPLADLSAHPAVTLWHALEAPPCYSPAFHFPTRKPTGAKLALTPFYVWGIRVRLQVGHLLDLGDSIVGKIMGEERKIHLTYPRSHSLEDVEWLYERFKSDLPDTFASWVHTEKNLSKMGDDPLLEVQKQGLDFLMKNTRWDNLTALSAAWSDLRRKVIAFSMAH
jgi:hypothetical protein